MKKFILFIFACMAICYASAGNKKQTEYRNALVLAYSPANSHFEDENIGVGIYDGQLMITNKTPKTVFLDLSQCFISRNGKTFSLTDYISNGKSKKKKSNDDEFLSIAPNTTLKSYIDAISGLYGKYASSEDTNTEFTEYGARFINVIGGMATESMKADPKGKKFLGTIHRHLTEDESIETIGASIAYASNKRTENWSTVSVSTWVSDVIFCPYHVEFPQDLKSQDKKGFGIKKTAPVQIHVKANSPYEFEEDKQPIVACDWSGNYKKGTFELNATRVSKKKTNWLAVLANMAVGVKDLFDPQKDIYYKSIITFDGANADWGKLEYVDKIEKMLTK